MATSPPASQLKAKFENSCLLILAWWQHVSSKNLVNIGTGNGLLSDATKPLPELMLTYH